jgi:hypothetical protein
MFEDLKRLFRNEPAFVPARDGLTGGNPALMEMLDLSLLQGEAKACDIAAGRTAIKDRPARQLRQAVAWRELARRSGDAESLRRAAAAAESAVTNLDRATQAKGWAAARLEQARCAMLGAELFGHQGLNAAAEVVLADIAASTEPPAVIAIERARIVAAHAFSRGDAGAALEATTACAGAIAAMTREAKTRTQKLALAEARIAIADLLFSCGMTALDERVVARALTEAARIVASLDVAYEPVTWARASILEGQILVALGELTGEAAAIVRAVDHLSALFDDLSRDHSPLDWARAQAAFAQALQALGQATGSADAFDQSRAAFDRALMVLKRRPDLPLRAVVAHARASLIALSALATNDLMALDEAEAAFRCELAGIDPGADAVGWAVAQLSLAEIYIARMDVTGRDRGERAKAALALDSALDVFGDNGHWGLGALAAERLERLRVAA